MIGQIGVGDGATAAALELIVRARQSSALIYAKVLIVRAPLDKSNNSKPMRVCVYVA